MQGLKVKRLSAFRTNNTSRLKKVSISIMRAVFLIAFSYILLYPVFFMISHAVRGAQDTFDPTVVWIPKNFNFSIFTDAFATMEYPKALFNTLRFEIVSALISTFTCAIFAYGLARFNFRFKKTLVFFLVMTIMVPDVMLILPRVMHYKQLDIFGILGLIGNITGAEIRPNILDTALAFYLPSLFGVGLKGGLFIFIYMQFFKGLPAELEEAAWIDGAGPIRTFLRIILPSSGVVIFTVLMFSIVWHWNDYYLAMMYTSEHRTLAYVVENIGQYIFTRYPNLPTLDPKSTGIPLASCLLFIAPPLVFYLFLQRKFIQSIDRVGIVG